MTTTNESAAGVVGSGPGIGPASDTGSSSDTGSAPGVAWCDRCGESIAAGAHPACAAARALEPPRFCPHCRRRMKVQVLPAGWSAVCVAHGETRSAG